MILSDEYAYVPPFAISIIALIVFFLLMGIKKKFDYNAIGGSIFLGARKIVVKAHGASKRGAILACCEQIEKLLSNNLNQNIEEMIKNAKKSILLTGYSECKIA